MLSNLSFFSLAKRASSSRLNITGPPALEGGSFDLEDALETLEIPDLISSGSYDYLEVLEFVVAPDGFGGLSWSVDCRAAY